jgi:hypothetical protein
MARLCAVVAAVLVAGVGCGYRFVARDTTLPEGVHAVCTPIFLNDTAEPGLETLFTRAMREQLVRVGTLGDGGKCDARLEGTVTNVGSSPTIITEPITDANGQVVVPAQLASYRAFAEARLRLLKDERVLSETTVSGTEDYLPGSGDVLEAEANRQAALHRLTETLMREGYERLARNW